MNPRIIATNHQSHVGFFFTVAVYQVYAPTGKTINKECNINLLCQVKESVKIVTMCCSFTFRALIFSEKRAFPCLERLLGHLKWNSYIQCITKNVGKIVGSLSDFSKYFTPPIILYLYKSQIKSESYGTLSRRCFSDPYNQD